MAIAFNEIPLTVRTPGFFVEIDGSKAVSGVQAQPHDSLLIGQKTTAGSATAGTPYLVESADEAIALFGATSQLAQMVKAYKAEDSLTPCWAIALSDNGSGVPATGSIVVTGTATEAGSTPVYIGGRRVDISVASGLTAANWEIAALAALALETDLPVTYAGNAAAGVDFTAVNDGTAGNDIYLGVCLLPGERIPAGLSFTVNAMASGATDSDYATAVTGMGEEQYHTVAVGTNSTTEIAKVVTEMESRWNAMRAIEGRLVAANYDTAGNLTTWGNTFNSKALCGVGAEKSALLPLPWELAAATAAIVAREAQIDPSRSYGGLVYSSFRAPARGTRFTRAQRDTLISDGVSTVIGLPDGRLSIERLVSTYQTNSLAIPDTAFQDFFHVGLIMALRYTLRARIGQKFARFKLASNGSEISGQPVATPNIIKGEILMLFKDWQELGWVENFAQFKAELKVERDLSDPNRINAIVPPDLINAFLVGAFSLQFRR